MSLIYMNMNLTEELIFNQWFSNLEMAYCWAILMAFPWRERGVAFGR